MKKALAILFISCANLILLAHMVVPHHHHADNACFDMPFHAEHQDCCEHQHAPLPEQDEDHESDACSLSDLFIIIPDGFRQEKALISPETWDSGIELFAIKQDKASAITRYKQVAASIHGDPVLYPIGPGTAGSTALRAPPCS